jgi:hypothetical protein
MGQGRAKDAKLRLKALAARFFIAPSHMHDNAECPLCESKLSGDKRNALAAELEDSKRSPQRRNESSLTPARNSKKAFGISYLRGLPHISLCSPACNPAILSRRRPESDSHKSHLSPQS